MARDGGRAPAGLPYHCFAALLAFLPLCLALPASFLVLPLIDFAPCLALLATPMADSSVLDEPVAALFPAGWTANLAVFAASLPRPGVTRGRRSRRGWWRARTGRHRPRSRTAGRP